MRGELCGLHPSDWDIAPIQSVCERVISGGTPNRRQPVYYQGGNWSWVKTQELQDTWIEDTEEHITDEAVARSSAKILPKGTVLLALYGATVGQLGLLRRPMTCNQACCAMIVDPQKADKRYLFYQLLAHRAQLRNLAVGAAQQNLSGQLIKSFQLPFPPVTEQSAIAAMLGSLDDKIDLNRRMNETLGSMAQALFKDWFMDFGPTRAKVEGQAPYLAPEIWDLFPDSLDDEDKPVGWQEGTIGECFQLTIGQSPPGYTYNDDGNGLPFFQGRTDFGFRFPKNRKYCTDPTRLAHAGDTLVSVRAPVGDINMAWEECCIGRGVSAIRHNSAARSFTYYSAWAIQQEIQRYEHTGTVFGSINKKQFEQLKTIEPDRECIQTFEDYVGLIDDRVWANVAESRTLADTRDLLLPKLMFGEIRLCDVEKAVEAVL